MTADNIDDDDDFPALREQLGCPRLHPRTLCGKKPFHVHELSSVDDDSDVELIMSCHQLIMILMLMSRWDWRSRAPATRRLTTAQATSLLTRRRSVCTSYHC